MLNPDVVFDIRTALQFFEHFWSYIAQTFEKYGFYERLFLRIWIYGEKIKSIIIMIAYRLLNERTVRISNGVYSKFIALA